jgi:hypothetical protein
MAITQCIRVATSIISRLNLLVVFFLSSCYTVKQPPLTELEKGYFNELSEECKCKVEREVDPGLLSKSRNMGGYLIKFSYSNCDVLKDTILWKVNSYEIARRLYRDILHADSEYNKITIVHQCQYQQNGFVSRDYEYTLDTLLVSDKLR